MPPEMSTQQQVTQEPHQSSVQVPLEYIKVLADEAAARAASKVLGGASQSSTPQLAPNMENVTLGEFNKYVRLQNVLENQIEKRNRGAPLSIGEKIAEKIDNAVTDDVVNRLVGGIFKTGEQGIGGAKRHTGFIGALMDLADTKMGYAFGEKLAGSATEIIKMVGQERVGQMIDSYTGRAPPEGQPGEMSPEEQQKRTENALMQLDTTNPNHITQFMQATGIKDYNEAQKVILTEQNKILQRRGLPPPTQEQQRESPGRREPSNRSQDLNRQLIEQYETGQPGQSRGSGEWNENNIGRPPTGGMGSVDMGSGGVNMGSGSGDGFFAHAPTTGSPAPRGLPGGMREDEFILSLNSDDPISQQQYMSYRNISGVSLDIVKKMLIKEQNKFRSSLNRTPVPESGHELPSVSPNTSVQDSIDNEAQVMKKDEFYKEIGLSPEKNQKEISQEQASGQQSSSDPMSNIENILKRIGDNVENNLKIMNDKIEQLESKISILESGQQNFTPAFNPLNPTVVDPIDIEPEPISMRELNETVIKEENKSEQEQEQQDIKQPEPEPVKPKGKFDIVSEIRTKTSTDTNTYEDNERIGVGEKEEAPEKDTDKPSEQNESEIQIEDKKESTGIFRKTPFKVKKK